MNRSTIYEYLRKDTELELRFRRIGKGNYPVLKVPDDWEHSFLLINNMRVTDFQALMLFSKELVVRFDIYEDMQINIPYKHINYLDVRKWLNVGYMGLNNGEKVTYE